MNEMLLEPLYKNVCRQVEQKLCMLRKIRRNINNFGAISLYKQMIMPLFDYSVFLLLSCTSEFKIVVHDPVYCTIE